VPEVSGKGRWGALRDYLGWYYDQPRAHGLIEHFGEEMIVLVKVVPPPAPPGRLQKLMISHFVLDGENWVELGTEVCPAEAIDPVSALRINNDLAFGHLALNPRDSQIWYRHSFWLDILEPPWLPIQSGITLLTKLGDDLELRLTGEDRR
jgi:hypothetical protein